MKSDKKNAGRSAPPIIGWTVVGIAVLLHVAIVLSIARQPLFDAHKVVGSERSVVWSLCNDSVHRIGPAADFFAVYHAGYAVRIGANPYVSDEPSKHTPYFYPFRYLPVVGQTLGRFFSQFSPRVAYWIWIGAIELTLSLLIWVLTRCVSVLWLRYVIASVLLLSVPYFLEIHMGQFTFVALSLLVVGTIMQTSRRGGALRLKDRGIAASCFVVSVLLKVLPLVAIPAFLRNRNSWWPIATAVVVILIVVAPYFATHGSEWEHFQRLNFSKLHRGMDTGNFGFVYFIYNVTQDISGAIDESSWKSFMSVWHLFIVGATACLVLLSRNKDVTVGVAAMVLAHFASYGHVWEHHYSGVIPVALMLFVTTTTVSNDGKLGASSVATLTAIIILALPTPFVFFDVAKDVSVLDPGLDWGIFQRHALVLSKAAPLVLLYAMAVRALVRPGWRSLRSAHAIGNAR